jgi:hypothetical protein
MGTATYTGDMLALDAFSARAGDAMVQGVVSANLSGAVPQIKASLSGARLDLDALLGGSTNAPAAPMASAGASGWSDARIDFSALKSVNAELNLSVEQLSYGTIKAGPASAPACSPSMRPAKARCRPSASRSPISTPIPSSTRWRPFSGSRARRRSPST